MNNRLMKSAPFSLCILRQHCGIRHNTTPGHQNRSIMSKFKPIVWPRVILFGDSITQVRLYTYLLVTSPSVLALPTMYYASLLTSVLKRSLLDFSIRFKVMDGAQK